jgi:hypothetical protein
MGMVSSLCLEKWSSKEVSGRDNGCNIYLMLFIENPSFSQDMVCNVDLELNNGTDNFPLLSCLDDISCEYARFPLLKDHWSILFTTLLALQFTRYFFFKTIMLTGIILNIHARVFNYFFTSFSIGFLFFMTSNR